jgi:hypothetical protein
MRLGGDRGAIDAQQPARGLAQEALEPALGTAPRPYRNRSFVVSGVMRLRSRPRWQASET